MERHVTVVGARIIGMCAASYLQRAGRKVTVIDSITLRDSCPPAVPAVSSQAGRPYDRYR